jgi:hypothetical protein
MLLLSRQMAEAQCSRLDELCLTSLSLRENFSLFFSAEADQEQFVVEASCESIFRADIPRFSSSLAMNANLLTNGFVNCPKFLFFFVVE